jgi:hypothetical protein
VNSDNDGDDDGVGRDGDGDGVERDGDGDGVEKGMGKMGTGSTKGVGGEENGENMMDFFRYFF